MSEKQQAEITELWRAIGMLTQLHTRTTAGHVALIERLREVDVLTPNDTAELYRHARKINDAMVAFLQTQEKPDAT